MHWSRVLSVVGFIALLLVTGAFVLQAFPGLAGADAALIVQSGSMEPAISTGSVVFVAEHPPDTVSEGDIITFSDDEGYLITHRVHEVHRTETSFRFITKGDANENADPEPVYRSNYVGKVPEIDLPLLGTYYLTIPFMGYVVSFSNTGVGWLVLVVAPVMLLIANELWTLYDALEVEEAGE